MNRLNDTQLSKKLAWLLRHGAIQEGISIAPDGFVPVLAILQHKSYAPHYNLNILQRLVKNDAKQRYELCRDTVTGEYKIRANQGHSLDAVKAEDSLCRIDKPNEVPLAVHGTYYKHWPAIKEHGLNRMTRNHIHFAVSDTNNSFKSATSGFRNDCQLLVYLNVTKAMQDGAMLLYRSSNNVILCAGINGVITKEYFVKVIDRKTGKMLEF